MPVAYTKSWLSIDDQIALLQSRGMLVDNEARARYYLGRIGYYRLSGYWFPFRERSGLCCVIQPRASGNQAKKATQIALDVFKPGTRFEDAVQLYVFDKRLRLHCLDALERIEVSLRVDLSHLLGRHDKFAHLDPKLFHPNFAVKIDQRTGLTEHQAWLAKQAQLITRSNEDFIRHNRDKYGLPLPIWVACEIWDFGCMSRLYGGLIETEQDEIAQRYGVRSGRIFARWLHSLNYLRNVCAHHARLWNRNVVQEPKLPPAGELPWVASFIGSGQEKLRARPFLLLCITQQLMQNMNPSSSWGRRLDILLNAFPGLDHLGVNLAGMGLPQDWETGSWLVALGAGMKKPPSS